METADPPPTYEIPDTEETGIRAFYWDEWDAIAVCLRDNLPAQAIAQLKRRPIKTYSARFTDVVATDLNRARIMRLDALATETNALLARYDSEPDAVVLEMKKNVDETGRLMYGSELFKNWF